MSTFCPSLKQCTCCVGSKNKLAAIEIKKFHDFSDAPAERSTLVHCPLERSSEKIRFEGRSRDKEVQNGWLWTMMQMR